MLYGGLEFKVTRFFFFLVPCASDSSADVTRVPSIACRCHTRPHDMMGNFTLLVQA